MHGKITRLFAFITFVLITSSTVAETAPSLSAYVERAFATQPGNPRHAQATLKLDNSVLIVGFVEPDLVLETMESQGLLYVVLEQANGSVEEIAKAGPFPYYTAGGRTLVENINISSLTRFSIQFNHRGACTSGFEIYRFAKVGKEWRVAGRDETRFQCGRENESMGDTRSEWSGNFLTGNVVAKECRSNKFLSSKSSRQSFPAFTIERFSPFEAEHGPR